MASCCSSPSSAWEARLCRARHRHVKAQPTSKCARESEQNDDDGDGDDGDDGDDGLKSEREALCQRVKTARDNLKASRTPGAARELLAATAALTVNKYRLVGLPKRAAEQVQSVKRQSRSRKYSGEWTYTFSTKFCTSAPFRDLAGANAVVDLAPSHYWPQVPTPCVFCAEGFKQEVICKGWTLPKKVHGLHGTSYVIGRKMHCKGCGKNFLTTDARLMKRYAEHERYEFIAHACPIYTVNKQNCMMKQDVKLLRHMGIAISMNRAADIFQACCHEEYDEKRAAASSYYLHCKCAGQQTQEMMAAARSEIVNLPPADAGISSPGHAALRSATLATYSSDTSFKNALRNNVKLRVFCIDHHKKYAYRCKHFKVCCTIWNMEYNVPQLSQQLESD